jgi:hypothetical protein
MAVAYQVDFSLGTIANGEKNPVRTFGTSQSVVTFLIFTKADRPTGHYHTFDSKRWTSSVSRNEEARREKAHFY